MVLCVRFNPFYFSWLLLQWILHRVSVNWVILKKNSGMTCIFLFFLSIRQIIAERNHKKWMTRDEINGDCDSFSVSSSIKYRQTIKNATSNKAVKNNLIRAWTIHVATQKCVEFTGTDSFLGMYLFITCIVNQDDAIRYGKRWILIERV